MHAIGIVPARYASTRLPGKPLLSETGRPLIQHVVEAATRARRLERVIVATDDERIARAVRAFGGDVVLTRPEHISGTDRVAEVAARFHEADVIVNIQGDEPELEGSSIDRVVELLEADPGATMATLCTPIDDEAVYRDPGCVKVVLTASGRALYFSRSPVPHHRDGLPSSGPLGYLHLGLYAYRRQFLLELAHAPASSLESAERLEQLRVLEAGYPIAIAIVHEAGVRIDTPEDYRRFVERWKSVHTRSGAA
jgi:3-deoxy-manno-octulosonate cytidylyltransferase (CMP-KDO synthetase)